MTLRTTMLLSFWLILSPFFLHVSQCFKVQIPVMILHPKLHPDASELIALSSDV